MLVAISKNLGLTNNSSLNVTEVEIIKRDISRDAVRVYRIFVDRIFRFRKLWIIGYLITGFHPVFGEVG